MKFNKTIKYGLIQATIFYLLLSTIIFISNYLETSYSEKSSLPNYGHGSVVTLMIFFLFVYINIFIVLKNVLFSIFYKSKFDIGWSIIHIIAISFYSFYFKLI